MLSAEGGEELDTLREEVEHGASADEHEVKEMLEDFGARVLVTEAELPDTPTEALANVIAGQKELLRMGHVVGEKGRPHQMVADATLAQRYGVFSTSTIKTIKISPSIWHKKPFTENLLQLCRCICVDEDGEPVTRLSSQEIISAIGDNFLVDCQPGNVPDLAVVHGALNMDRIHKTIPDLRPAPGASDMDTLQKTIKPLKFLERRMTNQTRIKRLSDEYVADKPAKVKRLLPEDLDSGTDPTIAATERLYAQILDAFLPGGVPVNLLHLCTDRTSFHKTVERFFCFSFLLRDQMVGLYLDDQKVPVCFPLKLPEGARSETLPASAADLPLESDAAVQKYTALMMNLTVEKWQELVKAVKDEG